MYVEPQKGGTVKKLTSEIKEILILLLIKPN